MIIKMLALQAGPTVTREAGKLYDVPDKEAKALIEGGYALEVSRETPVEKAVAPRGRERTGKAAPEADA